MCLEALFFLCEHYGSAHASPSSWHYGLISNALFRNYVTCTFAFFKWNCTIEETIQCDQNEPNNTEITKLCNGNTGWQENTYKNGRKCILTNGLNNYILGIKARPSNKSTICCWPNKLQFFPKVWLVWRKE